MGHGMQLIHARVADEAERFASRDPKGSPGMEMRLASANSTVPLEEPVMDMNEMYHDVPVITVPITSELGKL